jgi:diguanylate cyclase (GGDEF)-like protein/PAS domain S-box-containing protein
MHDFRKEDYFNIINNIHDGVYFVDRERKITFWNKGAERISGFTADEVMGKSCLNSILTHIDCDGNYLCEQGCPLQATMDDKKLHEDTVYMHHKDGHRIPVHVRTSPLMDKNEKVIGGIEIFTDVSKQEANLLHLKELEKLALIDALTSLANRRYIEREIVNRLSEMERFNVPFGLLFMDLDYFKSINDMYGHEAGDDVLRYVAKSFTTNSRPFDLYGRWGGEEFVAIIRNVDVEQLKGIADRVRQLIQESYIMREKETIVVTISIGATLAKVDDSLEEIIRRADENMYRSKKNGRNRVTLD